MALKKRDNLVKSNRRCGVLKSIDIECGSEEFKEKLKTIRSEGIVIQSIATQPVRYKYKISYYDEKRVDADLSKEEWRDIPGKYYANYQISSLGRIRAIRVLKEYEFVTLTDGGKNRTTVNVKKLYKEIFP